MEELKAWVAGKLNCARSQVVEAEAKGDGCEDNYAIGMVEAFTLTSLKLSDLELKEGRE